MEFYESHLKKRFQVLHLFHRKELSKNLVLKKDLEWKKGHPSEPGVYWLKDDNEYCTAFFFNKAPHWGSTKQDVFIVNNDDLQWAEYK